MSSSKTVLAPNHTRPPLPPPQLRRPPRPPRPLPYVPPFRHARHALAHPPPPPFSPHAQRLAWATLVKRVHGVINRVSPPTVATAAKALLRLNVVRARGVLCKTLLRAQAGSPGFTDVFAALVAVINTRVPGVVALLVARLVAQLRVAYGERDREMCFATGRFVAALYKHQVVAELVVLEFLATCLQDPSDGSVELAVGVMRECGPFLVERSPKACDMMFQRLRDVLHEGEMGKRAQVDVENLMAWRRKRFQGGDVVPAWADLVEEEDMVTHFASLEEEEEEELEEECNGFVLDPEYEENERIWNQIRKDILGAEADEDFVRGHEEEREEGVRKEGEGAGDGAKVAETDGAPERKVADKPTDMTEADLVDFRRTVYLTFQSGLTSDEWAHKLIRLMRKHPRSELELCNMMIESCSQEKTFDRTYGLVAQRMCLLKRGYGMHFEKTFATHYATIHRFDTRKIRNMACFYAFLLAADALPWNMLQVVRLVEEETTSSSRIFLKILFQEMSRTLGASRMTEHVNIPELQSALGGVFPTDNARNARFSINFFVSIGLGFLAEGLRQKLPTLPQETLAMPGTERSMSSTSSSSLSSSSLSSSSLSPSSRAEDGIAADLQIGNDLGPTRVNGETSPPTGEPPIKTRRTSVDGRRTDDRRNSTGPHPSDAWRRPEESGGQYRELPPKYDDERSAVGSRHRVGSVRVSPRIPRSPSRWHDQEGTLREMSVRRREDGPDERGENRGSYNYTDKGRRHASRERHLSEYEGGDSSSVDDHKSRRPRKRRAGARRDSAARKSPPNRYYSDSEESSDSERMQSRRPRGSRRHQRDYDHSSSDSGSASRSAEGRYRRNSRERQISDVNRSSGRSNLRSRSPPARSPPPRSVSREYSRRARSMSESSYSSREGDYKRRSRDYRSRSKQRTRHYGPDSTIRKRRRR